MTDDSPAATLIVNTAIAGFVGAFFSYLFVRMAEVLKALYDRQVSSLNALVATERWLIVMIDEISNNVFEIDETLKLRGSQAVTISFNKLTPLGFDLALLSNLLNLAFINEVALFGSDVRKIDHTIHNLNSMHAEVRSSFLSKSTDARTYQTNFGLYLDKLQELRKFFLNAEGKGKRLVATCRLLMRRKPLFTRVLLLLARPSLPPQKEIEDQLAALNEEIKRGQIENAEEIRRVRNNR